ncbi:hypothetical protein [Luteolibacter luteus]|uniref:hypothetical protein n=1 Tax=Luteolibacter luteus TaxID=2728835 RepID=UPI00197BF817|nr:hypothetical protein [Luteolibacter luteus]
MRELLPNAIRGRDKPVSTFPGGEIPVSSGVRRFAASAGFTLATLILATLSWALWQSSFVAAKGVPAVDLHYTPREVSRTPVGVLREEGETAVLEAAKEVPRIELRWIKPPPARYAHVSLDVSAQGVVVGNHPWEDARIFLMWFDHQGKMAEGYLPLWSGSGDQGRQTKDVMLPLARDGTLPWLIIENRGSAGVFKVHSFSMQPAELRPGLGWMLALLLLSWLGLIGFALRRWVVKTPVALPRIAIAAALWVGFAWVSSFPGPWIPWHPLGKPFPVKHLDGSTIPVPAPKPVPPPAPEPALPPVAEAPAPAPVPVPAEAPPAVATIPAPAEAPPTVAATPEPAEAAAPPPASPSTPETPVAEASGSTRQAKPARLGGGPVRWFLNHLPGLKRPIHLLAFAGLTTLIALLTGSSRAGWPAFALGILSEFSQWAYGFGSDGGDIIDLAFDGAAVLAGIAVWHWFSKLLAKWQREPEAPVLPSPASDA